VEGLPDVGTAHVREQVVVLLGGDGSEEAVVVNVQVAPRLAQPVRRGHEELAVREGALVAHAHAVPGGVPDEGLEEPPAVRAELGLIPELPPLGLEVLVPVSSDPVHPAHAEDGRSPGIALVPEQIEYLIVDQAVLMSVPATRPESKIDTIKMKAQDMVATAGMNWSVDARRNRANATQEKFCSGENPASER
jgi:hypothetical protein